MSSLSTHILDISTGKPAPGVTVFLARDERVLAQGITDGNGRIGAFSVPLTPGRYRLVAQTGEWFAQHDVATLFPCAQIDFVITEGVEEHFHLPFLIAPGGWSTYRGS
ncbi:5-hydroxyisourate hydrolase precursor [Phytobacter ursingii]|uniref:5-hydroxyisourate hydrolase n=1 Tax=Phytobacter ursingii TaxID=1972431 RepID=A0AB35RPN8_9ENTR|nr:MULTISPECIES: hydroxyisourate hydrolase [Enterobacteriaceae]MDV2863257.1 hydroxyisourate hydrolase [Phytobacter ursingii]GJL37606.1 5-hydroxyisourate hydrolase [Enterobacter hormaechei]VTP13551.1 5-hydroxyisourate hydrolase precursor [Phytobacter ursingii]